MARHQPEDRRAAILNAAIEIFDARGFAAATMEEVAAAAGISKGSVYNYFNNKQDLFHQVFDNTVADVRTRVLELMAQPLPASQKLLAMVDYYFQRLDQCKRVGRLVLECWATAARDVREGELSEFLRRFYAQGLELISSVLRKGVESGEFQLQFEPEVGAALIMGVLDGIQVQVVLEVGVKVDEQLKAGLARAVMAGLTAGDKLPPPAPAAGGPEGPNRG